MMKVTFDKDGYVEMLVKKGDLPNSIILEDDDTIDMRLLSCYKLGYNGTQLVFDAQKAQKITGGNSAEALLYDLKKQVAETDYKVLRHIRENALGIHTSISEQDYLLLEAKRESIVRKVREIEDGTKLETDVNAILQEGYEVRLAREEAKNSVENIEVEIAEKDTKEPIEE